MTEYYIREDGTATKENATGPASDPAACMSQTVFNASTFADDDIINFSDQGGSITTYAEIPSSGTSGHNIVYRAVAGESPIINPDRFESVAINAKSYLDLRGIDLRSIKVSAAGRAIDITGISTDITIEDLVSDLSASTHPYIMLSDGTLTNLIINGANTKSSISSGTFAYYHSGASIVDAQLANITHEGGTIGIFFNNVDGLNISTLNLDGGSSNTILLDTVTGLIDIDGVYSTGREITLKDGTLNAASTITNIIGSSGIILDNIENLTVGPLRITESAAEGIENLNGTANILYDDFVIDGAGSDGVTDGLDVDGITYTDGTVKNSAADGFVAKENATNITHNRCKALDNGQFQASTTSGDGFTYHDTNSNILDKFCLAIGNNSTGWACVGASSGEIKQFTSINNGTGDAQVRAEMYFALTSGAGWTCENGIVMNIEGYPLWKITDPADFTISNIVHISNIAPTDDAFIINGSTPANWAEWVAALNDTDSIYIHKDGSEYKVYDSAGDLQITLDYCPVSATGEPVNRSDNPILAMHNNITGIDYGVETDIRGRLRYGDAIPGCYQGVDIPKLGGRGFLMLGGGMFG